MMDNGVSLLCTGDLHLGRHPSRVPGELDDSQYSPTAVWHSTVDEAIDRNVDVVLVSGDIIDRENRFFEAFGPFEEGATRLDEADIPLVVVSGNHDFDVVPDLVGGLELGTLEFLGADGTWERTEIVRDGEPLVYVDGWSFPNERYHQSPIEEYDFSPPDDAPVVGLVHADLDAPESHYAPVATDELVDTQANAWLLGHIHSPGVMYDANPFILYPGSPQGFDPGEPGAHGPWVLSINGSGRVDAEHVPLANVQYDHVEIDVSETAEATALPSVVSDQISQHVGSNLETTQLELLLARVTLTGRTPAHGELVEQRGSIENDLALQEGSVSVEVESLEVDTRPAVDLEELAQSDGPAGYLAELLLSIDAGEATEEYDQLVPEAFSEMQTAHAASAYRELRSEGTVDTPEPDDATQVLERQAKLLLDELIAQKEGTA